MEVRDLLGPRHRLEIGEREARWACRRARRRGDDRQPDRCSASSCRSCRCASRRSGRSPRPTSEWHGRESRSTFLAKKRPAAPAPRSPRKPARPIVRSFIAALPRLRQIDAAPGEGCGRRWWASCALQVPPASERSLGVDRSRALGIRRRPLVWIGMRRPFLSAGQHRESPSIPSVSTSNFNAQRYRWATRSLRIFSSRCASTSADMLRPPRATRTIFAS